MKLEICRRILEKKKKINKIIFHEKPSFSIRRDLQTYMMTLTAGFFLILRRGLKWIHLIVGHFTDY